MIDFIRSPLYRLQLEEIIGHSRCEGGDRLIPDSWSNTVANPNCWLTLSIEAKLHTLASEEKGPIGSASNGKMFYRMKSLSLC
jgi:hypothetical protein